MIRDSAISSDLLATGKFTHDYAIDFDEARAMGLPINDELPREIYRLMDLYPQPSRATSVQYIPQPYRREPAPAPQGRDISRHDPGR